MNICDKIFITGVGGFIGSILYSKIFIKYNKFNPLCCGILGFFFTNGFIIGSLITYTIILKKHK